MYNRIKNLAKHSKYNVLLKKIWRIFVKQYPYSLGNEIKTIKNVIQSGNWNMSSDEGIHSRLEADFAKFIGVKHSILVSSGGMAIQMAIRALGLKPGDEIIHQVDTCVADAFAVMNAGATPIFSDVSLETYKINFDTLEKLITPRTKAIIPIHIWGNVENMDNISAIASKYNLKVIEDCALAIGATYKSKKVGQFGDVGIFSFGSTKPLQAGEGGIITTNDDNLAKQLKTIRNWGDKSHEYGIRDQDTLSWNGRMSEVTAALIYEQFKNYHKLFDPVKKNVSFFLNHISQYNCIELADKSHYNDSPIYSILALKLYPPINKQRLMQQFKAHNIPVWHANFEPIVNLSFFKNGYWKDWALKGDLSFIENNYNSDFTNSNFIYSQGGIGIMRDNFITKSKTKKLIKIFDQIITEIS